MLLGKSSRSRARDQLRRSNVRILGVLINNLPAGEGGYGYYYHYYGKTAYGDSPSTAKSAQA